MKGIVWQSGQGNHLIARAQNAEESGGNGMGTGHKVIADQCILTAEDLRQYFIQHFTTAVTVAVASGSGEVGLTDAVLNEGGENLFTVVLSDLIDLAEALGSHLLRAGTQYLQFFIDVEKIVTHRYSCSNSIGVLCGKILRQVFSTVPQRKVS